MLRFQSRMTRLAALLVLVTGNASAWAITINPIFVSSGNIFPVVGGTAGGPPVNSAGGGSLTEIFDAAAESWELGILDDRTVHIAFGWDALAGENLAIAAAFSTTFPTFIGTLRFDNDGSSLFFSDSTPRDHSEYVTFAESQADLGGGSANTGRVLTDPTGAAVGRHDLLTVAKHEIGHLLGVMNLGSFSTPTLTITSPLPYAGTAIPTTTVGNGHIEVDTALMFGSLDQGTRKLQSAIDILAAAQNSGDVMVDLDAVVVPEPPTFFTWSLFASLGWIAQRRAARDRQTSPTTRVG